MSPFLRNQMLTQSVPASVFSSWIEKEMLNLPVTPIVIWVPPTIETPDEKSVCPKGTGVAWPNVSGTSVVS